jgi:hypothetical protein
MKNMIQSIAIDKFVPHPDNPNRMSKANFAKLVRNIKRTGRYEPLVVRPYRQTKANNRSRARGAMKQQSHDRKGAVETFQIINGHHRWQALSQLGYKQADAVVWDIDDQQTDILLATLNRLGGSDILDKKLALLSRLNKQIQSRELAKLLPHTAKQIERLTRLKDSLRRTSRSEHQTSSFANPIVFFVDDQQKQTIENALSIAAKYLDPSFAEASSAKINAAALTVIVERFLAEQKTEDRGQKMKDEYKELRMKN